ncbi:Na+/H+ antiporter family protein [Propioniciclava soli]|uniref:Na+/H+ antiporter NhaC family protein n=1 Tax=Propioniciclava soli TaxID=2775081 RepID=A0ABZ3C2Y0_9ACTN|nr:Na+/H+ antiporter NhaC family protein [Propioniciclava soli]
MNAVVLAVLLMLVLAFARVHVVMALIIGAIVGGLLAGLGLAATMESFTAGIANGASIALSYAVLGAFAVAIAHSGLPQAFAGWVTRQAGPDAGVRRTRWLKWGLLGVVLAAAVMSQNVVPIHIAFIPLLIPPLLVAFNRFGIDRRAVACILTFGLVTTYMYLPYGFGNVFLNEILLGNISQAGLDTTGINILQAMGIPALGMVAGLLVAVFVTYRRPRAYADLPVAGEEDTPAVGPVSGYRIAVALVAVVLALVIQIVADSLLLGALVGFAVFLATGVVRWGESGSVFNRGIQMMAMIGFIMIAAQGFAQVMQDSGQVEPLVTATAQVFGDNKAMAAFAMLLVGLLVTMGIGSSFSTLPIITTIYVPLCLTLGFSPLATVALIGTAGALGDAGSPASDSTLGPTAGLAADGQHDHVRDTVIPTFLHYNIPLLLAGWVAALVL